MKVKLCFMIFRRFTTFMILVLAGTVLTPAQQRQDASAVFARMRTAIGGEAVLDAVQTFSVEGTVTEMLSSFRKSFSLELLAMLPDHFMTIRRDMQPGGPMPIDITYYNGFRGNELIRWTDSNLPFPPDPGPQTPQAIAQRRAENLLRQQRSFARLAIVLIGKSFAGYPLQFTSAGPEVLDGRPTEVVEGRSADGYVLRLHVDAATNLPALVTWEEAEPFFMTTSTSSEIVTRGGQVVSQTPPVGGATRGDPAPMTRPIVTWRLVPSEFKTQNGVNWPRRFQVLYGRQVSEEMRLGSYRINPKINPRRFIVGRS